MTLLAAHAPSDFWEYFELNTVHFVSDIRT